MKAIRMIRFGVLLALGPAAGCGAQTATVSGRVLFDGMPLPAGTVTFRPDGARLASVTTTIDEQGRYRAELPVGLVWVCVNNLQFKPRQPPQGLSPDLLRVMTPEARQALAKANTRPPQLDEAGHPVRGDAGKYVAIPARYYNVDSSGLGFRVEKNRQVHDIEMKP